DFHPSWQQVSWLDTETGETGEQKLVQASGDAERFYRQVAAPALIGMEATGNCHWLVDLLSELGHELWVGDAAQIRASYVRQQKERKSDVEDMREPLGEGRFPRASSGAGADRHGSHRQLPLAGGFAGRGGPRAVGGRCGADSCQRRAAAEDGQA